MASVHTSRFDFDEVVVKSYMCLMFLVEYTTIGSATNAPLPNRFATALNSSTSRIPSLSLSMVSHSSSVTTACAKLLAKLAMDSMNARNSNLVTLLLLSTSASSIPCNSAGGGEAGTGGGGGDGGGGAGGGDGGGGAGGGDGDGGGGEFGGGGGGGDGDGGGGEGGGGEGGGGGAQPKTISFMYFDTEPISLSESTRLQTMISATAQSEVSPLQHDPSP